MIHARAPRSILLCDDNPHAREVMARVLQALGLTVTEVSSGQEAVAAAEAKGFDMALIDIEMPEMDGYATAEALRGLVPHLIAITGHDSAMLTEGIFDAALTKPLNVDTLVMMMNERFAA